MFNTFSYKNTADNVVVMSEDNYDAIMETLSVNSNDYLMRKLARGDEQFKNGGFKQLGKVVTKDQS